MNIKNLFKHEKRTAITTDVVYDSSISALSVIFGQFLLDNSASTLSAFFAARELISNSIAQLPINVKLNNELVPDHPLKDIFDTCLMSRFNLIKQLVQDVIDYGNAICYIERDKTGTPIKLIYCEHGTYTIDYNRTSQKLYYKINNIRRGRIEPIDVLHFYKNSYDGVKGTSIVAYANQVLNLSKATDRAASNYYKSGCAIQGALTIKGSRKNAKEQARAAFAETHSGSTASGLVILDDDMSYTPLSSNANESQMLETRLFNISEIARYFNISPVLLGDLSKSSYSTIEASSLEFVMHTLMPYISMIESEINRKLIKPSEQGFSLDFDETYLIRGDKQSTATYLTTLVNAGIITRNEARKKLGLNDIEGLDDVVIPYTNVNDNKINGDTDNASDIVDDNDNDTKNN